MLASAGLAAALRCVWLAHCIPKRTGRSRFSVQCRAGCTWPQQGLLPQHYNSCHFVRRRHMPITQKSAAMQCASGSAWPVAGRKATLRLKMPQNGGQEGLCTAG